MKQAFDAENYIFFLLIMSINVLVQRLQCAEILFMYICCAEKNTQKEVYFIKKQPGTFKNSHSYSSVSYTWFKSLSMIRVAVKAIRKDKGLMSPFFLIKKVLKGIYPQLSTEIIQKV